MDSGIYVYFWLIAYKNLKSCCAEKKVKIFCNEFYWKGSVSYHPQHFDSTEWITIRSAARHANLSTRAPLHACYGLVTRIGYSDSDFLRCMRPGFGWTESTRRSMLKLGVRRAAAAAAQQQQTSRMWIGECSVAGLNRDSAFVAPANSPVLSSFQSLLCAFLISFNVFQADFQASSWVFFFFWHADVFDLICWFAVLLSFVFPTFFAIFVLPMCLSNLSQCFNYYEFEYQVY